MESVVRIRELRNDDLSALRDIAEETYVDTFSEANSEENMRRYVSEAFSLSKIRAELSERNSKFYFAERGCEIAGYLKLNHGEAQTERLLTSAIEIERIYVRRKFQGLGIGNTFLERSIEVASHRCVDWLWLGVWEQNVSARGFYERAGFRVFADHAFWMGSEEQRDLLMKKPIGARI